MRHAQDVFQRRRVALSEHPRLSELEQQIRTQTLPYLRTDVKQRAARLREQLEPDEQALLVLRVDRGLAWSDIAQVMAEQEGGPPTAKRDTAALRKRFERVKAKLKGLMEQEGLLEES